VTNTSSKAVVRNMEWLGSVKDTVALDGGSNYSFDIRNESHFALSVPVTAKMRVTVAAVPQPSRQSFFITCDPARLGNGSAFHST